MAKTKKTLMTAVAVILIVALSVGATLAYLTYTTETEKNVFSFGNVKIKLYESRFDRENGYDPDTSDTTLYNWLVQEDGEPAGFEGYESGLDYNIGGTAFSDEQIMEDSKTYQDYLTDEEGNPVNLMPGGQRYNKFAYVQNTGKNPAFIRIHMQVPATMLLLFTGEQIQEIVDAINFGRPNDDSHIAFRPEALMPKNGTDGVDIKDYLAGKCGNEFITNDILGIAALVNVSSSDDPDELADRYIEALRSTGYLFQDEETGEYFFDIISYRFEPLEPGEMSYWGRGYSVGVPAVFDWGLQTSAIFEKLGFDMEEMNATIKVYAEAVQSQGFEEGQTVNVNGEDLELTPMQAAWYAVDESSANLWYAYLHAND